jgi:hypothetical protein
MMTLTFIDGVKLDEASRENRQACGDEMGDVKQH